MSFETIALGASLVGAGTSAYGALHKGAAADAASDYNVALLTRNAGIARDQAAADADDQARAGRRYLGSLQAAFGASGLAMEGSALDYYEDAAMDVELAGRRIRYGGDLKAAGLLDDAELQRMKGDAAGSAALIGAASYALQGAGSYATWQDRQDHLAAVGLSRQINRDYRLRRGGTVTPNGNY